MQADVIIVGGGIAGLIAARKLSEKKIKVVLLEASDRFGGRIHTVYDPAFDVLLETGPEFIHGNLPVTIGLLEEAGIHYYKMEGRSFHHINGKWKQDDEPATGWNKVLAKMQSLQTDQPINDFLEQCFAGEKYTELKKEVRHYAEGFDLADCSMASTFALRDEWLQESDDVYRVKGGYSRLTDYLVHVCKQNGVMLHSNCAVTSVEWESQSVKIYAADGRLFTSKKMVLAVPIKTLQHNIQHGGIDFVPPLPSYQNAADKIGFGAVIKIFLQFKEPFWEKQAADASFIISNQLIPTWWTQLPYESNMLTGWLGGPAAKALRNAEEEILLRLSLESLANIFSISTDTLRSLLQAWRFCDWSAVPFIGGGYSYATVETPAVKAQLNMPVEDTIYFAGEAVAETDSPGTVEAALESGIRAARNILE